jgi:hypothetical protein
MVLKMEKNERKEIENAIFDDDGNLITADKTWMEKEYEFKRPRKARVIPRWVVKRGGQSDTGLWTEMGYNCDEHGPRTNQRRKNLISIYESEFTLESISNKSYIGSFGTSGSDDRFARILSYLNRQITANRHIKRMAKPVSKWESDLKWFKSYVGKRHPNLV